MIDNSSALESGIGIGVKKREAQEVLVDTFVNRPVNQSACGGLSEKAGDGRVGIKRIVAALREAAYHGGAPRIASEEPVSHGSLHMVIPGVAGGIAVEPALS